MESLIAFKSSSCCRPRNIVCFQDKHWYPRMFPVRTWEWKAADCSAARVPPAEFNVTFVWRSDYPGERGGVQEPNGTTGSASTTLHLTTGKRAENLWNSVKSYFCRWCVSEKVSLTYLRVLTNLKLCYVSPPMNSALSERFTGYGQLYFFT